MQLYYSGFLERLVRSFFLDSFQGAGGEFELEAAAELRNVDFLFLEVESFADLAGRIILRGAGAVGVTAADN